MSKNVNLIIGSGVIGAYLARELISKKEKTIVTSRKIKKNFKNYEYLKIRNKVTFEKLDVTKKKAIEKILDKYRPNKIFYFAGESSIPKSVLLPKATHISHYLGTKNFLEVLKKKREIKFFKSNSGYIFKPKKGLVSLKCKFSQNKNPYISTQKKVFKLIDKFREFNLLVYNLVLLQVESPLRPNSFFIKKVCLAANKKEKIIVGNISTSRDYSWATEIVKFIYRISHAKPQNFLISTGKKMSGSNILKFAYDYNKLDYRKYYIFNKKFFRKNEERILIGDPRNTRKLEKEFNLKFRISKKLLIKEMLKTI